MRLVQSKTLFFILVFTGIMHITSYAFLFNPNKVYGESTCTGFVQPKKDSIPVVSMNEILMAGGLNKNLKSFKLHPSHELVSFKVVSTIRGFTYEEYCAGSSFTKEAVELLRKTMPKSELRFERIMVRTTTGKIIELKPWVVQTCF